MSTPPAPPKSEPSTRVAGALPASTAAPAPLAAPTDRTVEADLLVDVPQLAVEELTLELEASVMLNRLKLEAKGLQAGLYLKADFENLRALTQQRSAASHASGRGLRELLGATREAYRDLSDRNDQQQLRDVHASSLDAHEQGTPPDATQREDHEEGGNGAVSHDVAQRVRHAAAQGAKAAGLTAAGLAGGALLEARVKPSKKLPRSLPSLSLPRRRSRAQVIRDEVLKRLPSPA
jgi:hypothetical protein